jgi:hypothetical protein
VLAGMFPSQLADWQAYRVSVGILFIPYRFNHIFPKEVNPISKVKGKNGW